MTTNENDSKQPVSTNFSIRDAVTLMRSNAQLEILNESPESADNQQAEADASEFKKELERLISRYSRENNSNTPDWILANFMQESLNAFEQATRKRDRWYGVRLEPGNVSIT